MADEQVPKSNVVPFSINGVTFTDRDEPIDMTKLSLAELVGAIDAQGFEGEAGPLENSREWIELKRRLKKRGRQLRRPSGSVLGGPS